VGHKTDVTEFDSLRFRWEYDGFELKQHNPVVRRRKITLRHRVVVEAKSSTDASSLLVT